MDFLDKLQPALELGGITVVFLFVLRGLWVGISWLGEKFLIPLRDTFVRHLQSIEESLANINESFKVTTDTLRDLRSEIHVRHDELNERVAILSTRIERLENADGQ